MRRPLDLAGHAHGGVPGRAAPDDPLLHGRARRRPRRAATARVGVPPATGWRPSRSQRSCDDAVAANVTFNRLIQGFMGLGLVVGVAALGVISARAVVERRQQIGVLRSIGFRREMVQAIFLLESSFVALTAIVVGRRSGSFSP